MNANFGMMVTSFSSKLKPGSSLTFVTFVVSFISLISMYILLYEYIHYNQFKLIREITYIPQGTAFRPSDPLPIIEGVKGGRMSPLG